MTGYIGASSYNETNQTGFVIKTDLNGNEEWTKTFAGNSINCATYIQNTNDGNFIISGATDDSGVKKGLLTEVSPSVFSTYYADTDGDTYGDPNSPMEAESQPAGYVLDNTDCDDSDSTVYPGATDIRGDSIDQNCQGGDLPDSTDPTYIEIQNFVNRFYNEVLDRDGDTEGLEYWADSLSEQEMAGSDVATGFIYSDEFQSSNLADDEYLEVLYQLFLIGNRIRVVLIIG